MPRNDLQNIPLLLTFGQAAGQLGISLSKIKRLASAGELPVVDVGERNPRIRRDDLAAYVDGLTPRAS